MPEMERNARRGSPRTGDVERVDEQRLRDAGGEAPESPQRGVDEHIVALTRRQNLADAMLVVFQRDRLAVEPGARGLFRDRATSAGSPFSISASAAKKCSKRSWQNATRPCATDNSGESSSACRGSPWTPQSRRRV